MNNTVYGKTTENIRNRIDVKLGSKEKDYLKGTSKPSYMSQKVFDTDLVAIRKDTQSYNELESAQSCVSYRNKSFVLLYKSNDWFLYEITLG